MAKDDLLDFRAKKKYVFEWRYQPILESFDKRGLLLQKLNNTFKQKISHWKVSNIEVQLMDEPGRPSKIISADHKTSRMIYEDPGSLHEFNDDAKKFITILYETYGERSLDIIRVGVRFQSIFTFPKYKTFETILCKLREVFINPSCPLTINISDCQFIFNHESGHILIGPVRNEEQWIMENFLIPDKHAPAVGLGVDIDSFALQTSISSSDDLYNIFSTVEQLTLTAEKEIIMPFITEDKK